MADKEKIIKNIKTGGSIIIYIGTAGLMQPIVLKNNEQRNAVGKICAGISGTVLSCGIANFASKYFGKLVDDVTGFIDDVRKPKKKEVKPNG